MENPDKKYATPIENEVAKKYDDLVKNKLKDKLKYYLQTKDLTRDDILNRIVEIQDIFIEMSDIQYKISQITPETKILKFIEIGNGAETEAFAYAIDEQAKNWLNRLSTTLNVLTIKASEFSERSSVRRDICFATISIILSTILGIGINFIFDSQNDKDLDNQTLIIKEHQDSISNIIRQEYILNFDTLKCNANQKLLK